MITLPGVLQVQLRTALHQYPTATWSAAAQALSQRYRAPRDGSVLVRNALDALAYAALIMPATYAQLYGAFAQITPHHAWQATSLLDLGSGPGTASWVANHFCTTLQQITAVERDPHLQQVARMLASDVLPPTTYVQCDITDGSIWPSHDIVVIGHVLNELTPTQRTDVIARAWHATRQLLIIVEPGAPAYFPIITTARQQLIGAAGYVVAPCTHQHACPMPQAQWCHFGQKIARPETQRTARGSELGWEEAKFTFVAMSRIPVASQHGMRVMHDPIRTKGSIAVVGCDRNGIHTHRAMKRDTQRYAAFRRAQWGSFVDSVKEDDL